MPRPIWKGSISFGLVNVPVSLYPAEERRDISLHMLDARDHARIRFQRINENTGEEVPWDQIVKGYEIRKGEHVVLTDEDLKSVAPEATRTIDIESFVEERDIDPVFFDKPYYLEPAKNGLKGYALLREALLDSGRVGVAKVVIRTKQYVAAVMPRGRALTLALLRYADEVRPASELDLPEPGEEGVKLTAIEKKTARMLVEGMTTRWDPKAHRDEYREALLDLIRRKAAGEKAPALPQEIDEDAPEPINFIELLQRSIEARGGAPARPARKSRAAGSPAPKRKPSTRRKAG